MQPKSPSPTHPEPGVKSPGPCDDEREGFWLVAWGVLGIALLFVPPTSPVLNAFDPPKRVGWAILALALVMRPRAWRCRRDAPAVAAAGALVVWMAARTLLRPNPAVEIEVLFTWLLPPVLFLAAHGVRFGGGAIRRLGALLLAGAYLQAALMVMQRSGFDPLFAATTEAMAYAPGRMVGTIGYHNQAVDFLLVSCVGALWVSSSARVQLAWMAPLFAIAVLTGNRGGVLAFVSAAAAALGTRAVAWLRERRRTNRQSRHPPAWRAWLATIAVAVLVFSSVAVVAGRLSPTLAARYSPTAEGGVRAPAVQSRLLMWRIAAEMARERPLLGWGAGEYAFQYLDRLGGTLPERKTHAILTSVVYAREAHNDPLQFLAEFGFVGLLLLLGLVAAILRPRPDPGAVPAGAGGVAVFVLVGMTASALFSFPWQCAMAGPMAGLILGLATTPPQTPDVPSRAARAAQIGLVATALAVLAGFGRLSFLDQTIAEVIADPEAHEEGWDDMIPRFAHRHQALLGAVEAERGLYDAAIGRLAHAQSGYRDVTLWNNLGHALAKAGRWDEAATVYARWAATGIEHDDALANLSVACENAGAFPAAAAALDAKVRLWPQTTPAEVKRLAVLFMRARDCERADRAIWRSHRRWKDADAETVAEMENLAGSVALLAGDAERAEPLFKAALQRHPGLESARRNLENLKSAR